MGLSTQSGTTCGFLRIIAGLLAAGAALAGLWLREYVVALLLVLGVVAVGILCALIPAEPPNRYNSVLVVAASYLCCGCLTLIEAGETAAVLAGCMHRVHWDCLQMAIHFGHSSGHMRCPHCRRCSSPGEAFRV